jgi:hypothetical protein
MKPITRTHVLAAAAVAVTALAALPAGTSAATTANAVTKTFSFIGKANSSTQTLVNVDGLLINARCDSRGNPIVFGFSSSTNADLFGRLFDGLGRIHIIKNSSFTSKLKGLALYPSSGDYDTTGIVLFETSAGKVVTVNFALDNSTTLGKLNVCTVYGSYIAT